MSQITSPPPGRANHPVRPDGLTVRKLFILFTRHWLFFVAAVFVALLAAAVYYKYTIPTFQVSASVLIEEEGGAPNVDLLQGFDVRQGTQNLDNQIQIIKSYRIVHEAIEELSFEVDCYRKGLMSEISYYPLNPLRIVSGRDGHLPFNSNFIYKYTENGNFRIWTPFGSDIELDTIVSFGQEIVTHRGSFVIYPQRELEEIYTSSEKLYIRLYDNETLTAIYRSRLMLETSSRDGTIVILGLAGTNRTKDIMFINKLCDVFINNNLEKKNMEALRTIEFIEEQLVNVSDSLTITENQLQEFRSRNRIMDVSAQGQQIIDQALILENENARLVLERNYFEYLDEYLADEETDQAAIAPATMGIIDPLLATLMQDLASLQAEYYSSGIGTANPLQANLELRIQNTKESIRETLEGIMLANEMALTENTNQINSLNYEASKLPITERKLLGIERRFNLNNVLYTFLLQRRAEAQIQKASNQPDNEIIDFARASTGPIKPNLMKVFAIAMILGIGLPFLFLIISNAIRNRINSDEDLKLISDLPVVGHIPLSRLGYKSVVLSEPLSPIAESFRSLRARMEFFYKDASCPLIMFSSSIPGEGKTFAALNLASAYSLAGKKTIMIGLDLRRPTLSEDFDLKKDKGLSTFLIGKDKLEDIISDTGFDNLHMISSGPVPPNPGELASSEKLLNMFAELKEKYDYIIVDTAPIGTVSDAYSVAAIADAVVMIVRLAYSDRKALEDTLQNIESSGINHPCILVNGIKATSRDYRYKYKYTNDKNGKKNIRTIRKAGLINKRG